MPIGELGSWSYKPGCKESGHLWDNKFIHQWTLGWLGYGFKKYEKNIGFAGRVLLSTELPKCRIEKLMQLEGVTSEDILELNEMKRKLDQHLTDLSKRAHRNISLTCQIVHLEKWGEFYNFHCGQDLTDLSKCPLRREFISLTCQNVCVGGKIRGGVSISLTYQNVHLGTLGFLSKSSCEWIDTFISAGWMALLQVAGIQGNITTILQVQNL
ncbi:hypothetical protein BDN72DRAFT_855007 [Pluteus cervinus]|uniref:Uncharacterized protein n=1 Tax=Pluteus cervinus TaxID=181527 RepID=A0ACD3B5J5_9AGAR|nr:hypothetical protein BDN72DRAFT_855007 [Pluteus cervinus]